MSKRKSALVVNTNEDFAFEDQEIDSPPPAPIVKKRAKLNATSRISTPTGQKAAAALSSSSSRVSGRAKKVKSIYDPSESLKPAGKRKRGDTNDEEKRANLSGEIDARSRVETSILITIRHISDIVKSSPVKVKPEPSTLESEPIKILPKPARVVGNPIQPAKTIATTNGKAIDKVKRSLLTTATTIAASKEPSKRVQERKKRTSLSESTRSVEQVETPARSSEASPEVAEWSGHDVAEYFQNKLGFSKRDCALFRDEEIDGEALLIMKRSDIVNSKFNHIKLGTAIKFWTHILRLQTKSNDPTQAWV